MDKAIREMKIWLTVGIATSVLAVASIPLLVLTALKGYYFAMAVFIALVAHGFYGVTFYFLAYANSRVRIRCIEAFEDGQRRIASVARYAMIREDAARDALTVCIKKSYITGFVLSDSELVPISREDAAFTTCEYCGNLIAVGEKSCSSCGATKMQ